MNKLFFSFLVIFSFVSCSSSDSDNNPGSNCSAGNGVLSMTISGTSSISDECYVASVVSVAGIKSISIVSVDAFDIINLEDGVMLSQYIVIGGVVPESATEGCVEELMEDVIGSMVFGEDVIFGDDFEDENDLYQSIDDFTLCFDEVTASRVSGTFSGVIVSQKTSDTKTVSNGTFNFEL